MYEWVHAAHAGQTTGDRPGRSVLVVASDDAIRYRWAVALARLGFRPLRVDSTAEGERLLTSLIVCGAVISDDLPRSGEDRVVWNRLLHALGGTPTLLVLNHSLGDDEVAMRTRQLASRVRARSAFPLDIVLMTRIGVSHLAADPARLN